MACRACACNTLFLGGKNDCANRTRPTTSETNDGPGCYVGSEYTYVTDVLNSSATLAPTANLFINICASDTRDVLDVLALHADKPEILYITLMARNNVAAMEPTTAAGSDEEVIAFPPAFGQRSSAREELWPLAIFVLEMTEIGEARPRLSLPRLPPNLWKMTGLKELTVRNTQLESLEGVEKLTNLVEIQVSHNKLTGIPAGISRLSALNSLNLYQNLVTSVPPSLGDMPALNALLLAHNLITSIPSQLGRISTLASLALFDNRLSSIPPSLGNLPTLGVLSFNSNLITSIPSEIGQISTLESLFGGNNNLTSIPSSLENAVKLKHLQLENNSITYIPFQLGHESIWV